MSTSGNRVDPNLKEETIRQWVTIFGIAWQYFPWTPVWCQRFCSIIQEWTWYNGSNAWVQPTKYLWAVNYDANYAYWFWSRTDTINVNTIKYIYAFQVNKITGEVVVAISPSTSYGIFWWNIYLWEPTSMITDWILATFTRLHHITWYDWQIVFDMSTNTWWADGYWWYHTDVYQPPTWTDFSTNKYYPIMWWIMIWVNNISVSLSWWWHSYYIKAMFEPLTSYSISLKENIKLTEKITTTP